MGDASLKELPVLSQHEELQDLEPHRGKTVRPSLQGDGGQGGGGDEVDSASRVIMIEPDIMVDKGGLLVRLVLLDRVESNGVFEDRGIEIVDAVKRKAV